MAHGVAAVGRLSGRPGRGRAGVRKRMVAQPRASGTSGRTAGNRRRSGSSTAGGPPHGRLAPPGPARQARGRG